MKVTSATFTTIAHDGSAASALSQHFSNSLTHGPTSFPSTTKLSAYPSLWIVILSITDSSPASRSRHKRAPQKTCGGARSSYAAVEQRAALLEGHPRLLPAAARQATERRIRLIAYERCASPPSLAVELASVSDLGKGNGYARTRRAGVAANSLNIKDDRKRGVREGVSNVETVEGVGVKCRTVDIAASKREALIGFAHGALRRSWTSV